MGVITCTTFLSVERWQTLVRSRQVQKLVSYERSAEALAPVACNLHLRGCHFLHTVHPPYEPGHVMPRGHSITKGKTYRRTTPGSAWKIVPSHFATKTRWSVSVVFNLGCAKTSYINRNETQQPLDP
jgi:hypothetical protein